MPKATKAAAKKLKRVEQPTPLKRTKEPFYSAEEKFFGKCEREYNYRDLPEDDPVRVHIEKIVGGKV